MRTDLPGHPHLQVQMQKAKKQLQIQNEDYTNDMAHHEELGSQGAGP